MGGEPGAQVRTRQWLANVKTALAKAGTKLDRTDWYRVINHADTGVAEIYLYDEIGYWGTTAQEFVDELKAITATRIDLHINSPGGEVFDGIAIHSCLRAHPATVNVYIDGLAASAASFIAQAGTHRVMARNAMMMIHDASGLCIGDARDMHQFGNQLDQFSNNIADIYARRAGGTVADWRERMLAETWYSGTEAVAAGLADEMSEPTPPPSDLAEAMNRRWDLSMFRYAGREHAPAPVDVSAPPPPSPAPSPSPAGRAFPGARPDPPATPPATPPAEPAADPDGDGFAWTDDLAAAFSAAMRDEPDDDAVAALRAAGLHPQPVPAEPDVLIDPVEFYNAVREGTRS